MSEPPTAPNPSARSAASRATQKFRPFCSKRCADVDLNRWLSGVYAVPVVEDEDEDGTPSPGIAGEDER